MIIKHAEFIKIDSNDIFKNDKLNRKGEVENIAKIIKIVDKPATFSIDADWGVGKTTFVRLLEAHLQKDNEIKTAYLNAWENDFNIDPFLLLTQNILKQLNFDDTAKEQLRQLSFSLMKNFTLSSVDIASLALDGVPVLNQKIADTALKPLANKLFSSLDKQESDLNKFKETISDKLETTQKIVIFVDELDRCRPTFALEVLERIKHLFNIKGIVFILSTNVEQLCHSVSAVYGQGFNSEKYLERFVDFSYRLKTPSIKDYWEFVAAPVAQECELPNKEYLNRHGCHLVQSLNFTFRDIKRFYSKIALCYAFGEQSDHLLLILLISALKYHSEELYHQFITFGKSSEDEIHKLLDLNKAISHEEYGADSEEIPLEDIECKIRFDFLCLLACWNCIRKQRTESNFDEDQFWDSFDSPSGHIMLKSKSNLSFDYEDFQNCIQIINLSQQIEG